MDDSLDHSSLSLDHISDRYLSQNECILIVDDYPDVLFMLKRYLDTLGLPSIEAGSLAEMHQALANNKVALVLLDIDLPDGLGSDVISEIKRWNKDLRVIMLTAMSNLEVAMDCMRKGADDFIAKPARPDEFNQCVCKVLEKRWLERKNRRYQQELEQSSYRTELLHRLTTRMNTVYMGHNVLDEILQAVLVGITAAEGLAFNRAFLLLYDDDGLTLRGKLAIGPACREDAGRVWADIKAQHLQFDELVSKAQKGCLAADEKVNAIARRLVVSNDQSGHLLARVAQERRTAMVVDGRTAWADVDPALVSLLGYATFVVVPLFAPERPLGVIIADNFITAAPIPEDLINALEVFASHASVAIEHGRLYIGMQRTISELTAMAHELNQNKDKLIRSERYSAIGQMAGRLVHKIRNPITSLGGTARMLRRRDVPQKWVEYLNVIATNASRVENILNELFSFIEEGEPKLHLLSLYPLVHEAISNLYRDMMERKIKHVLNLPDPSPILMLDERQFIQLIQYLVRNSTDALAEGGTVTLTATVADDRVVLTVADNGPGFSREVLARAGEPFFTTKPHGSGMGLSLARRIVLGHGGELVCGNGAAGGAEVRVTLPRCRDQVTVH